MSVPGSLKSIAPFIARSNEFAKVNPLVTYYCRRHALLQAVELNKLGELDDEGGEYLQQLLDIVESEKDRINPPPAEEGKETLEAFANRLFKTADDADRAGKATQTTVMQYYSSAVLMECLTQFGELDEDVAERVKYAKFKAADIKKALASGVRPMAGPPGGAGSTPGTATSSSGSGYSPATVTGQAAGPKPSPQPPAYSPQMPPPAYDISPPAQGTYTPQQQPATQPKPAPLTTRISSNALLPIGGNDGLVSPVGRLSVKPEEYKQAERLCRFAYSALEFADVGPAVAYLNQALKLLHVG